MYNFIDNKGTFELQDPELTNFLYFPIANEAGMKSSITPTLAGDAKTSQNSFLLQPVSAEELHNNKSSRNFWCKIDNKVLSLTGVGNFSEERLFTEKKDITKLTAGIMWHKVERFIKQENIYSEIVSFVPSDISHTVEIMMVTVENRKNTECTITPTAAIPMYARSADNIRDHRHVTSLLNRVKTTSYGVENTPTLTFDERGHKKNELTYYIYGCDDNGKEPIGYYPTVDNFIGEGGSFTNPKAVFKDIPYIKRDVCIDGYEAMGGIRFEDITLKPNESKTYILLLGITSKNDAMQILELYNTKEKVKHALENTKSYWDKKININYCTNDKNFDNFMHWVSFQPMLRRIYGCSFLPHHDYGKGGRGWRDLWQDCLALLLMNSDGVKEMLINNYKGVRIDGTNATIIGTKPGEFVADRNNISRVWSDHGVWPLITTKLYIDQTGDFDLLFENVEYFKDKQLYRANKIDENFDSMSSTKQLTKENEIYKGTIFEHILIQNLTAYYEVGKHGFLKLRGADWNDALDMASENGESVAFTAAYAQNLDTLAELLEKSYAHNNKEITIAKEIFILLQSQNDEDNVDIEKHNTILNEYCAHVTPFISGEKVSIYVTSIVQNLRTKSNILKKRIRKTEWLDSCWYNGYYDNNCRKVEGIQDDGNIRMMLTSQVFTIMSSTATDEQVKEIVKNCDKNLYTKDVGGYRLNTNFNEVKDDLGRMFGFAYGQKENGAVFSHMTVMYANALYKRGFVKEGFKALDTLYKQSMDFDTSKIYPGIPEYFDGRGRGMYHYLTGAASWYMMTVVNEMFGVKGDYGNIMFKPKLLKTQFDANNEADISLVFRNKKIKVKYCNINNKEYGEYSVSKAIIRKTEQTIENNILKKASSIVIPIETIKQLTADNDSPQEEITIIVMLV